MLTCSAFIGTLLLGIPSVHKPLFYDALKAMRLRCLQVVTISGRTIRKAQVQPELADSAMEVIDALLAQIPADLVAKAKQARASRASRG